MRKKNCISISFRNFAGMKLIADSGSTKTDWVLLDDQGQSSGNIKTDGINPFHQSEQTVLSILDRVDTPPVDAVYFYGSGLRPELRPVMQRLLASRFASAMTIEAESDLLGAARALYGNEPGLACILGTGANSCLYDGVNIVENTPPLGYILGDEGSGAVLGRNFINALYKGALPVSLRETFEQDTQLTLADVVQKVYREPMANRWLASLSSFIYQHKDTCHELSMLVVQGFRDFIQRNILPYHRPDLPLSATGSIAYYYQTELAHAASLEGLRLERVEASPISGLVRFHRS